MGGGPRAGRTSARIAPQSPFALEILPRLSSWVISFSLASLAPVPGDPSRAQVGVSTGISDNMYGIEFNPRAHS